MIFLVIALLMAALAAALFRSALTTLRRRVARAKTDPFEDAFGDVSTDRAADVIVLPPRRLRASNSGAGVNRRLDAGGVTGESGDAAALLLRADR